MSLSEGFGARKTWGRESVGIQAGHDFERAVFGSTRGKHERAYMEYEAALEYARQHQPDQSEYSSIIKELLPKVQALCAQSPHPVAFYTALDTPLDLYHGVDAFFEQNGRIATVDVSLYEKIAHKADVLLVGSMDREGKVIVSSKEIDYVAKSIARELNNVH